MGEKLITKSINLENETIKLKVVCFSQEYPTSYFALLISPDPEKHKENGKIANMWIYASLALKDLFLKSPLWKKISFNMGKTLTYIVLDILILSDIFAHKVPIKWQTLKLETVNFNINHKIYSESFRS